MRRAAVRKAAVTWNGLKFVTALLALGVIDAVPARAAPRHTVAAAPATDFSSQAQPRRPRYVVRPRARIFTRSYARLYRQCTDGYAVEARATGPTIVPYMNCYWASH
jgi:hypothetical protein